MARHINADQMIADTEAMKQVCEAIEIDGIIKYIEEHIAADVQEVKHAFWNTKRTIVHDGETYCSECEYETKRRTTYCPNCGAKMDGRGNE